MGDVMLATGSMALACALIMAIFLPARASRTEAAMSIGSETAA
jgi:hypothetical protein